MDIALGTCPKTIDEFLAVRDAHATTPEGGAAVYCLALLMLSDSSIDQLVGLSAVIAMTELGRLAKSTDAKKSYKGYTIASADYSFLMKIRVRHR
jgi:hypothetical protein